MKKSAILLLALILAFLLAHARRGGPSVSAAESNRQAFLVRFGLDGREDVDWSGSLAASGARISGWQFDPKDDQASGASWKCADRPVPRSLLRYPHPT